MFGKGYVHFLMIILVGIIAYVAYNVLGIHDSSVLTVLIIVVLGVGYGAIFLIKRQGGAGAIVNRSMDLFAPVPLPEQLQLPPAPMFNGLPDQAFHPNAHQYDPQQMLTIIQQEQAGNVAPTLGYQTFSRSQMPFLADDDQSGQASGVLPALPSAGNRYGSAPLPALVPASPAAMPAPLHQLALGPQAFVDVPLMFTNAVILETPKGRESITRVVVEELARVETPLLFIDLADTYTSLVAQFPHGYIVTSRESAKPLHDPSIRSLPVGLDEAREFGRSMLHEGWQILFRVASYSSPAEAAEVLVRMLIGMDARQKQHRANGLMTNCVIVVSDAYRVLPDASAVDQADRIQQALLRILGTQGSTGMHIYLASRRISSLNQEALRACSLWMTRQPALQESRWFASYTGLNPNDLMASPHVIIADITTRSTFALQFRESRSQEQGGIQDFFSSSVDATLGGTADLPFDQR